MMNGSEFVRRYARLGPYAWEAAAVELARQGELTPWPWIELPLASASGDQAILRVQSDVLSVGPIEDHVRLPLTPTSAQSIANLSGALLPTPWLAYQIWRAAPVKLTPTPMVPNLGANLGQYADHSAHIDQQIDNYPGVPLASADLRSSASSGALGDVSHERLAHERLVSGHKKDIVVSNIHQPNKVLLFGWWRPSPPFPDVFDDGQPMQDPDRQPIQPRSNVHSAGYVDYSHGIRLIAGTAIVNGESMDTEALYRHPTLSALVSNEGPLRVPRYPSPVPPPRPREVAALPDPSSRGFYAIPTVPGITEKGVIFAGRKPTRRNW